MSRNPNRTNTNREGIIGKWLEDYRANRENEPSANDLVRWSSQRSKDKNVKDKAIRNLPPIRYRETKTYLDKHVGNTAQERDVRPSRPQRTARPAYQIDDEVAITKERTGTIKFVGEVDFAQGIWYGIELHEQYVGKNNGRKDGKQYFQCDENRGVFLLEKDIRRKMTAKDHRKQESWLVAHADRVSRRIPASGVSSDAETEPQSETATEMDDDGKETEVQDSATEFTESPEDEPPVADDPPPEEPVTQEVEPEVVVEETNAADDEVVDADEVPPAQVDVMVEEKQPMMIQVDDLDFYPAKEGENVLQFCANQNDTNLRSDLLDLYTNIGLSAHLRVVFEDLKNFEPQEQCTLLLEDLLPRLQKLV